jgi:hypothetical protein
VINENIPGMWSRPAAPAAGMLCGQRSSASYLQKEQGIPVSSILSGKVEVQPYGFKKLKGDYVFHLGSCMWCGPG